MGKKVEIVAKEYMRGKLLRSKVCSTMQIRRGEGMIGVLLDSDKGECMVSVGDSEGAGGVIWVEGVVRPDEGIRVCGGCGTPPFPPAALFGSGAWCFRTTEQGFGGVRHHADPAGGAV